MKDGNLSEKKLESIKRVLQLIDEECGGKAQEFADRTGVAKASVSHYKHHLYAPGQDAAYMIGKAFDVNPMWVMGFNVPKKQPNPLKSGEAVGGILKNAALMDALRGYELMDPAEQDRLVDIIRLIVPKDINKPTGNAGVRSD